MVTFLLKNVEMEVARTCTNYSVNFKKAFFHTFQRQNDHFKFTRERVHELARTCTKSQNYATTNFFAQGCQIRPRSHPLARLPRNKRSARKLCQDGFFSEIVPDCRFLPTFSELWSEHSFPQTESWEAVRTTSHYRGSKLPFLAFSKKGVK